MKTHPEARLEFAPIRSAGAALLGLGIVFLGTSCVSQVQYEEALAEVKYYQRAYEDLESFSGKLESENQRLQGELDLRPGEPIEAVATRDIDERLAELDELMANLGGAPGDVTVLSVEGGYGLRLADAVLFDTASALLKPDGRALLLKMANQIKQREFVRVWVRGHTDNVPVKRAATLQKYPHGNLQLSTARAIEVAAVLKDEGGIAADDLVVAGFGASDPVVPNTTAGNRTKNRRVEIFVIEDAGE